MFGSVSEGSWIVESVKFHFRNKVDPNGEGGEVIITLQRTDRVRIERRWQTPINALELGQISLWLNDVATDLQTEVLEYLRALDKVRIMMGHPPLLRLI